MCDIYNKAHLTIIAACAKKAGDGFLHDRENPVTTELPFWCPDGKLGTISVRDQMYAPRNEPVSQRAWCFQERLLSPRILNYASHTLQYHCQEGTKNVGNANNFLVIDNTDKLRIPDPMLASNPEEQRKIWREWKSVLANYTSRSLTCASDKLVALAGVAQFFERCWGQRTAKTEYLAGLWKHTFSQDILWNRQKASVRRPRPTGYRAPSWSWAATDGPIEGPGWPPIVEPVWTVRKCKVLPSTPGLPFDEILNADLEVDAILRRVRWEAPGRNTLDVALYAFDSMEDSDTQSQKITIGFAFMDAEESLEENTGFALVVGSMNKKVLHNLVGLLVVPTTNDATAATKYPPSYRRVGMFDVHEEIKDDTNEPFCDVEDWLRTPPQTVTIV